MDIGKQSEEDLRPYIGGMHQLAISLGRGGSPHS